jgi:hypothetical protein
MRTVKISALTLALLVQPGMISEARKKKEPMKKYERSSESVSESILFVLTLPIFLAVAADHLQRHAFLYERARVSQ